MNYNIKNSIAYIHKKTGGKTGFSVPAGFFDKVENSLTRKLKEKALPKNNSFEVPKSYFDELENTILAKVALPKKEAKIISLKEKILKLVPMAAAASIVLFIGLNFFIFQNTKELTFDKLADAEVENWISKNINLINENDIAIVYSDIEFGDSEFIPNSITDDELENYLQNQENISLILENK